MYPPYNLSRPTPVPDRRWMPNVELAPNCPRCDSSNTKFCYYNNYSLTQPRYFCKGCRRYWTKGGSLRNVPVGGGCRKNRRSKSVRLSAAASRRQPTSAAGNDHQELDGVAAPSSAATGSSSNIDLAVLYSKFLSQGEQADQTHDQTTEPAELVADQIAFDLVGSSSGSDQLGLTGEFDYCFDPAGFESMGIDPAAVDGDVYSANSTSQVVFQGVTWQPPEFSDVVGMSHHYNHYSHHHPEILGGDWCSSMDQSSFGAF